MTYIIPFIDNQSLDIMVHPIKNKLHVTRYFEFFYIFGDFQAFFFCPVQMLHNQVLVEQPVACFIIRPLSTFGILLYRR